MAAATNRPLFRLVFHARDRRDEAIVGLAAFVAAALDPCREHHARERTTQDRHVGFGRARDRHGPVVHHSADLALILVTGVAGDSVFGEFEAERPLLLLHL